MIRTLVATTFLAAIAAPAHARPDGPGAQQAAQHLDAARKAGWQVAMLFVDKLVPDGPAGEFPGLESFVADVRKLAAKVDPEKPARDWPAWDVDALVAHNPNFWRAHYEVAPGDPAWMTLHAALLLAGGEATRAQELAVLAKSSPDAFQELRVAIDVLLGQSAQVLQDFNAEVARGTARFDAGKRDEALAIYRDTLKVWPQNGWALYEVGYTLMTNRMDELGVKPQQTNARPDIHSKEVMAQFAESRKHDPFQVNAYQGKAAEALPKIRGLAKAKPILDKIAKGAEKKPVSEADLIAFTEGCQAAEVDELALAARQLVVIRRGRFDAADHPFIAKSLRRLAPGDVTEAVLKRLAGKELELRRLVEPERPQAKP